MTSTYVNPSSLLEQTSALARSIWPQEQYTIPPLEKYTFQIFVRTLRFTNGISVLLRSRLSEEALCLARSLFEDSLRLSDLAESPINRRSLLLGLGLASLQEARGLAHTAVLAGLEKAADERLEAIDKEQMRLEGYANRNGAIRPRKFRSTRDAAAAHRRLEAFWTYSLAHEMVHGSDLAFLFSRCKPKPDTMTLSLRTEDSDLELGVACFSAESTLHSAIAISSIFRLPGEAELRHKLSEIESIQVDLVAKRATAA